MTRALVTELALSQRIGEAVDWIRDNDESTLEAQIELSEIPAPSFGEAARGERMAELLTHAGLANVRTDEVGNVIGDAPGATDALPLIISAHLDTVFPEGTDVSVTRDGDLLRGPGICDDARGLTAMLTLARAVVATGVETRVPLRFVATVGEEGAGDLRGVKHLFGPTGEGQPAAGFISLDGAGLDRIVNEGLGSRRYRVTISGPGGHSWVDWGAANPIHELTRLGASLTRLPLPVEPQATLTIARIGGGKSINAIPQTAWLEIDTRCPANRHLDDLEARIRGEVAGMARRSPEVSAEVDVIGERPGGETPQDERLVQAALEATRRIGRHPSLAISSTDSNIPMSLGVPAVTMGCGGEAGMAHTTDEWYRNVKGPDGVVRALYTIALFAEAG